LEGITYLCKNSGNLHGLFAAGKCLIKKEVAKLGYGTLVTDKYAPYRQEAFRRLQTDAGKKLYAKRKTELLSVFGNIQQNMGFRSFSMRGQKKNTGEFWLICSAHYLIKLVRFKGRHSLGFESSALLPVSRSASTNQPEPAA
jgi:hypothetical protein